MKSKEFIITKINLEDKETIKVPINQKPRQGPLRPQTGGGAHRDKKKEQKQGKEKHKGKTIESFHIDEQSMDQIIDRLHEDAYGIAPDHNFYVEWLSLSYQEKTDLYNSMIQSLNEASNQRDKRNPTRDFLRRYPVSDKDVAKPVKKPEKKKPEQGVAEGYSNTTFNVGHLQEAVQTLGPQLYVPRQATNEDLKPKAQIWTSSAIQTQNGYTSAWVEWSKTAMPEWVSKEGILYDVSPGARILNINSDKDAMRIARKYGVKVRNEIDLFMHMPWDLISKDYDAIHHVPKNRGLYMSAWDVESTAWLNKKFLINPRKVIVDNEQPSEQGVAEGSLETDNMVSHIDQIIKSIYPRGGDKNTYMKLVAQEMPHVVRDNPKLFRRAFGIAYDRFFHIGQDDDQDDDFDYTDYSMRKGERGVAERFRDPKDWDEGNTEPPNNFSVYINGKKWKVFQGRGRYAGDQAELRHYQQLRSWAAKKSAETGKKWEVSITGERATESIKEDTDIPFNQCPHCRGNIVHESLIIEKQDACYHKVKSRYKVWPSAYASGALVQCRKKGASNWGKKK